MSRLLPWLLPIAASLLILRFTQWPFPYYTIVDELYGTRGVNYLNLALDFFAILLITSILVGLVELLLIVIVFKSIIKEFEEEKEKI